MTDKQPQPQGGTLVPYEAYPAPDLCFSLEHGAGGLRQSAYSMEAVRSILAAAHEHYAAQAAVVAQPQGDAAMPVVAMAGPHRVCGGVRFISDPTFQPLTPVDLVRQSDAQSAIREAYEGGRQEGRAAATREAQAASMRLEAEAEAGREAGERAARDAEIDRLRMRLTACGVAAMQNTRASVSERIGRDSPYWSASYGDVCSAVDREVALRECRPAPEAAQPPEEPHAQEWLSDLLFSAAHCGSSAHHTMRVREMLGPERKELAESVIARENHRQAKYEAALCAGEP